MFKRVLGNPRPKSLTRNIAATFTRPSHLITHQRIHTGEKQYECTRCDERFSDMSALNRHLKAHEKHVAERTCGETFHNHAPYNAHIRTAHSISQPATARKRPAAQKTTDTPAAKKHKKSVDPVTPQPSTTNAGSSSEVDSAHFPSNLVPDIEEKITQMYQH